MRVSLIVCTRNRAPRLPVFLASLAALDPPPGGWELILVDNASDDDTRLQLERFASGAAMPVRCVRSSAPGLSRARNVGIAQAGGDILAFTDDDCYPRRDYLNALTQVFDEGGYGFVGGRVVLHDPRDARVCVRDAEASMDIPPCSFVRAGAIHGANMAITREVLRAVGDFDPLLGAGSACLAGEDIDYIARASFAGFGGRYDPRPVVAHDHGRKPGQDAERQRHAYDYGRGAYYMKHVLDPASRRTYLSAWYRDAQGHVQRRRFARFRRELQGGARYVMLTVGAAMRRVGSRRRVPNVTPAPTR